jgi:hypothetical protein
MDLCDPWNPGTLSEAFVILLVQFLTVDEACEIMGCFRLDATVLLFSLGPRV